MKKIIVFSILGTVLSASIIAQKIEMSSVPAAVKSSFEKKFPGIKAKWEKEDGKYEAGFKQEGKTMSAMFEANGTFTESEMDIKVTELPANVLSYVKSHYKGKSIKEGAKITKADGTVNYEAEVNDKDVIFNGEGKFLKETKE